VQFIEPEIQFIRPGVQLKPPSILARPEARFSARAPRLEVAELGIRHQPPSTKSALPMPVPQCQQQNRARNIAAAP